MNRKFMATVVIASFALPFTSTVVAETTNAKGAFQAPPASIERGKYLVKVAGCNDCHTPGYALSGGKVPEAQWLMGDKLGWRGPWGTTYAANLRLYMKGMTETGWVKTARSMQARPPMPWFALHDMTEQDLRALYKYITTLAPAGEPVPVFVPPGREPQGPYVLFPAPPK